MTYTQAQPGSLEKRLRGEGQRLRGDGDSIARNSFNVQAHLDIRDLATLDIFFYEGGYYDARSNSDLLRFSISVLINTICEKGARRVRSVEEALTWMDSRRFSLAQFERGRQQKRLMRSLQAESLASDTLRDVCTPNGLEQKSEDEALRPDTWDDLWEVAQSSPEMEQVYLRRKGEFNTLTNGMKRGTVSFNAMEEEFLLLTRKEMFSAVATGGDE